MSLFSKTSPPPTLRELKTLTLDAILSENPKVIIPDPGDTYASLSKYTDGDKLIPALRVEVMLATLLPLHRAIIQETRYKENIGRLKDTVDRLPNADWENSRITEHQIHVRNNNDNNPYLVSIRLNKISYPGDLPVYLKTDQNEELLLIMFKRDGSGVTIGGTCNKPAHFAIDRSLPDPKHAQKQSWLTRLSNTAHRLSGGLFGREAHSIPKSGIEVGRNPGRDSANEKTVEYLRIVCEAIELLHREHFKGFPTP